MDRRRGAIRAALVGGGNGAGTGDAGARLGLCLPFVVAGWGRRRGAAVVLAGALLAIAPWTLRNLAVTGSPVLVCFGGGLNFYFGHNEVAIGYRDLATTPLAGLGNAAAIDARGWQLGLESLRHNPFGFVTRGVRKVGTLFAPPRDVLHANTAVAGATSNADDGETAETARQARWRTRERMLHGPLTAMAAIHVYALAAAALAVLVLRRGRLPAEIRLAAWVAAAWIAVHIVFWAQPRFRAPLDVPLALIAASGLQPRDRRAGERR